jgi:SAM-dependent methyltransferase
MTDPADRIIGLYDDQAEGWIADRGSALGGPGKTIDESAALDRFASALPPGACVLDVGCGSGWPWGAALLDRGFRVTGLDASARLIAHARRTLPQGDWVVGDMRTFDLGRTFDGLLIWYSLFHLSPGDQETALERILGHAKPEVVVMMTPSDAPGVAVGSWRGEPLYHASLGKPAYTALLESFGLKRIQQAAPPTSDTWIFRRRTETRAR